MAGIGSYEKGKAFTLKSGNKPLFKSVGSSPMKHAAKPHTDHTKLTDPDNISKINRSIRNSESNIKNWTKRGHKSGDTKGAIAKEQESINRLNKTLAGIKEKSSPAKMHKPGHTGPAPKTISHKEELLNQGFTPKDADAMIKSGAVTGVDPDAPGTPGKPGYEPPVRRSDLDKKGKETWDSHRKKKPATGKAAKPTNIKTIQNKRKKGGKLTKAERRQLDEYRIHVTEQK